MRRNQAGLAAVAMIAFALAGCESSQILDKVQDSVSDFNPFGTGKKPLPGERKALFPEGVPGVQQGVPAELVAGSQPAATEDQSTASIPPARTGRPAATKSAIRSQPAPAGPVAEEPQPRTQPKKTATPAKPLLRQTNQPGPATSEPPDDGVWPPPPPRTTANSPSPNSPRPAATPASQSQGSPWPNSPPTASQGSPWPSQQEPPPPPAWPTPR